MNSVIGNRPATTKAIECEFCGSLVFSTVEFLDGFICSRCELYSLYSDLFKSEHGMRPRNDPTMSEMRAWIAAYDARHPQVH